MAIATEFIDFIVPKYILVAPALRQVGQISDARTKRDRGALRCFW